MQYTDYSFLKDDSDFKYILDMAQVLNNFLYVQPIKNYSADISNISGEFLPLVLKAMDLSNVVFFLNDGKTFFEQFRLITTYDGFAGILKSLFLTEQIVIKIVSPCVLDIIVTNKNEVLISNYVSLVNETEERKYIDRSRYYVGFKSDASSSLENFFKVFLERFLPSGVLLNSIKINSFTELQIKRKQLIQQLINKENANGK